MLIVLWCEQAKSSESPTATRQHTMQESYLVLQEMFMKSEFLIKEQEVPQRAAGQVQDGGAEGRDEPKA